MRIEDLLNDLNYKGFINIMKDKIKNNIGTFIFIEKNGIISEELFKYMDFKNDGYLVTNMKIEHYFETEPNYQEDMQKIRVFISEYSSMPDYFNRSNLLLLSSDREINYSKPYSPKVLDLLQLIHTRRILNLNIIMLSKDYYGVLKSIRDNFDMIFLINENQQCLNIENNENIYTTVDNKMV